MSRHLLITLITLLVIAIAAGIAVFLTKGYTFSPSQARILGTGIISVSSKPSGAAVYIDGHLTTATDTTISQLSPRNYSVRIAREGYISWERTVEVKEGLVTEIKATLFPAIPTIYPLTFNGIVNPIISPDGKNLGFTVPLINDGSTRQKGGVWVWTMEAGPIAFARGAQPHQLVSSTSDLDFSQALLRFSPDSTQLLVTLNLGGGSSERNYLLSVGSRTDLGELRDITPTIQATLKGWEEDIQVKEEAKIIAIKDLATQKVASSSASLKWSPDETKFLIIEGPTTQPTPQAQKPSQVSVGALPLVSSAPLKAKLYNLGTTEKPLDTPQEYLLPEALSYSWLPDSEHLILVQSETVNSEATPNSIGINRKVVICEYDGVNCVVIYSGNFSHQSVFAWPDSSRLMLVTSFNTPTASVPNLFGINLK